MAATSSSTVYTSSRAAQDLAYGSARLDIQDTNLELSYRPDKSSSVNGRLDIQDTNFKSFMSARQEFLCEIIAQCSHCDSSQFPCHCRFYIYFAVTPAGLFTLCTSQFYVRPLCALSLTSRICTCICPRSFVSWWPFSETDRLIRQLSRAQQHQRRDDRETLDKNES